MTDRGREFIGNEFTRPTEGLAPAEVQVHGGNARLVIGKVLEEFAVIQAKYKLLINYSPLLGKDNSSKLVHGYDPGHTLGTGDQEPHSHSQNSNQIGKNPMTPVAKPARTKDQSGQDGPPTSQTTVPEDPKNKHEAANQITESEMPSLATQIAPEECPEALACE
ncbi:hypothetical protein DSO57_1033310 [Entomophthora muscae]|uniref:Uncharacterized protein n=1 Tax=Entomophthora muscae TaxID=34485 RepID=A0ACC2T0L5_9FUNG|nr:hypothetical protein DSO57_1033310 [Entomophthora muscae]